MMFAAVGLVAGFVLVTVYRKQPPSDAHEHRRASPTTEHPEQPSKSRRSRAAEPLDLARTVAPPIPNPAEPSATQESGTPATWDLVDDSLPADSDEKVGRLRTLAKTMLRERHELFAAAAAEEIFSLIHDDVAVRPLGFTLTELDRATRDVLPREAQERVRRRAKALNASIEDFGSAFQTGQFQVAGVRCGDDFEAWAGNRDGVLPYDPEQAAGWQLIALDPTKQQFSKLPLPIRERLVAIAGEWRREQEDIRHRLWDTLEAAIAGDTLTTDSACDVVGIASSNGELVVLHRGDDLELDAAAAELNRRRIEVRAQIEALFK